MPSPRRLLIISPHFPPTNGADMQRVRLYLPFFRAHGWEPEVLCVDPLDVHAPFDDFLCSTYPQDIAIHRVRAPKGWWPGQTIGRRSFLPLLRCATRLLKGRKFDLVYFSTTSFLSFAIGPILKRRFKVPYVLDYQDPWTSDYYDSTGRAPPGGDLRYALARLEGRLLEGICVRNAAGLTAVSASYIASLHRRFGSPADAPVLPFGSSDQDIVQARAHAPQVLPFDPNDGKRHHVYVGAAGSIMSAAFESLLAALAQHVERYPQARDEIRMHFIGTSYASGARAEHSILPIAQRLHVADLIQEVPERVPYLQALQCIAAADALILPTSDDPGYNPSKLFLYLNAGKPLLVLLQSGAALDQYLDGVQNLAIVRLHADRAEALASIRMQWLEGLPPSPVVSAQSAARFSAGELCRSLCAYFDKLLSNDTPVR